MLPTITVDDSKCQDPLACHQCLRICPTHVLGLGTNAPPEKFKETAPGRYIVRGVRLLSCTACGDCAKVCPQKAIQVTYGGD